MTTRMNDAEYKAAFAKLENAKVLNATLLAELTAVANECNERGREVSMGKRSNRGNSASRGRQFVKLINTLNDRFNVKISRYKETETYKAYPPEWSRWAKNNVDEMGLQK